MNIIWKVQIPSSYGLGVKVFFEDISTKKLMTDKLVNYEGVCRTYLATLGLLHNAAGENAKTIYLLG